MFNRQYTIDPSQVKYYILGINRDESDQKVDIITKSRTFWWSFLTDLLRKKRVGFFCFLHFDHEYSVGGRLYPTVCCSLFSCLTDFTADQCTGFTYLEQNFNIHKNVHSSGHPEPNSKSRSDLLEHMNQALTSNYPGQLRINHCYGLYLDVPQKLHVLVGRTFRNPLDCGSL